MNIFDLHFVIRIETVFIFLFLLVAVWAVCAKLGHLFWALVIFVVAEVLVLVMVELLQVAQL